tara:strand:- start:4718 stop:5125 length:408 start_codon:yes stop_codon:yes gene_type:complete
MEPTVVVCVVLFIGFVCCYHYYFLQKESPVLIQVVDDSKPKPKISCMGAHSLHSKDRNPWPEIVPNHMREHTSIPVTHTKFRWNSQGIQESEVSCQKDFPEIYDNPTIRHGLRDEHPQNWLHGMPNQEMRPMNTN